MEYIPSHPTLKYILNENGNLVTRDIWYRRGNFYLTGTEHELMVTPMATDAPFDHVVIRLSQELRQIAMHIPNIELAISVVEAFMTLPHEDTEVASNILTERIVERVCYRLEPIESDIISINNLSAHPVEGHGDALNLMIIIENALNLVYYKLEPLRNQGYYFGCQSTEPFDIILVRPF